MSFNHTELKPHAEPVPVSKLSIGEVYFMVDYVDKHMLVPRLRTLVFLGRGIEGEGNDHLYFQDIESHITLGPFPNHTDGPGELYWCHDNQLNNIFELEKATEELLRCILRRAKRQPGQYEFLDRG